MALASLYFEPRNIGRQSYWRNFILGHILKPFLSSPTRNFRRTFFNDNLDTPHQDDTSSMPATCSPSPFHSSSTYSSTLTDAPSLCMPELWENNVEDYFKVIEVLFQANSISDETTKLRLLLQTITKITLFCPTLHY